ncbi:MAG: hypothetical protein KDD34_06775 [Bdellovibrionales bacterium]|nr:hypothetical protein [Bdellovibrionales bacterium]
MKKIWDINAIVSQLAKIEAKGFIGINGSDYRKDDGAIGQILEKEFNIVENNLSTRDLGDFELKAIRQRSKTITLCHKKPISGLTPLQLFERFSYVKPSSRDSSLLKRKLFTTITGKRENSLGLKLAGKSHSQFDLLFKNERLSTWDISEQLHKISSIILVLAQTEGTTNSRNEKFYFYEAFLMKDILDIGHLITQGFLVLDLCIDQVVNSHKAPHDRGPHIRISKSKILQSFKQVKKIFPVSI